MQTNEWQFLSHIIELALNLPESFAFILNTLEQHALTFYVCVLQCVQLFLLHLVPHGITTGSRHTVIDAIEYDEGHKLSSSTFCMGLGTWSSLMGLK